MTATISTPRDYFPGIRDDSSRTAESVAVPLGGLIPHIFAFAEKGQVTPKLLTPTGLLTRHGSKTIDGTSDYATHAVAALEAASSAGAQIMFERMKPTDAKDPATITLSLEVVEATWDTPMRGTDGSIMYDAAGNPTPVSAGVDTTDGYKLRWIVGSLGDGWSLGQASQSVGTLEGTGAATIYPMIELPVSSFGSHGNFNGISLWAPVADGTSDALNERLVESQDALLYRLQMVQKNPDSGIVNLVQNRKGAETIDFAIREKFIDPDTTLNYNFNKRIKTYDGSAEANPVEAPFAEGHIYRDNWDTVTALLLAAESSTSMLTNKDMVNLVSCKTTQGVEYYNAKVVGSAEGGARLTRSTRHYATGGFDGTMSNEALDAIVANKMATYITGTIPYRSMAKFPHNLYIDSGFSVSTSKAMGIVLGARPDTILIASTQDAAGDQNTNEEDSSVGASIAIALRNYPESTIYGTSTCRAMVVAGSGYSANSSYPGLLPLSVDLAAKLLNFAGGVNFDATKSPDTPEYKEITGWTGTNLSYLQDTVQDADWNAGIIVPQPYDTDSFYYPAIQTVFPDAKSVLNSFSFIIAASITTRVCSRSHRALSGNVTLKPSQYRSRMQDLISEGANATRFANMVAVEPTTTYTDSDVVNGFSSTTQILLTSPIMKTSNTFTIVAQRDES